MENLCVSFFVGMLSVIANKESNSYNNIVSDGLREMTTTEPKKEDSLIPTDIIVHCQVSNQVLHQMRCDLVWIEKSFCL